MLSKEQLKEKKRKILLVCKTFLEKEGNITNVELSNKTGIPRSSVQRYLNDPLVSEVLGSEVAEKISKLIQRNLGSRSYKGGYVSSKVSVSKKDNSGHFVENTKIKRKGKYSTEVYQMAIKMAYYFITNECSISEVARVYNVSKETVRRNFNEVLKDCDEELYNSIKIILEQKNNPEHDEHGRFQGKK